MGHLQVDHFSFTRQTIQLAMLCYCYQRDQEIIKKELSYSEVILKEFKKWSFSPQTIAHIYQHMLQKYAVKINQTHQLVDGVTTSYSIRPNNHYIA